VTSRTRPPRRGPTRLSQARRLGIYAVGIGVWLSGVLWLLFHYFMMRPGEFGPSPDPLEPWWLKFHGAFAFAAIWGFGLLWGVHVVNGWSGGRRRRSGGALVGLLGWLIVSGYLLYYLGDDHVRSIASILHWSLGLAVPIAYWVHRSATRRRMSAHRGQPLMRDGRSARSSVPGERGAA
jgi:hypothetical protein